MTRKAFLIDTTRCMACRSCQVACKEWNKLPADATVNRGSYENPPSLTPLLYNQIHFVETEQGENLRWLFINRRCLHCAEAGCMKVCPSAGALFRTPEGLVGFDQSKCIGCNYCVNGCPFDVPRYNAANKITKCHGCLDRVENGMVPSCVKACPSGALQFGDRQTLLEGARAAGHRTIYGEKELGGLGVMYVIDDTPGTYSLPDKPAIPASIFVWKDVIKPLGILGFWGAIGTVLLHYVTAGPRQLEEEEENRPSSADKGGV